MSDWLNKKPDANSAAEIWHWVQKGRDIHNYGHPMPREQSIDSLAMQMGWRFEKVQADMLAGVEVVREAQDLITTLHSWRGRFLRWLLRV